MNHIKSNSSRIQLPCPEEVNFTPPLLSDEHKKQKWALKWWELKKKRHSLPLQNSCAATCQLRSLTSTSLGGGGEEFDPGQADVTRSALPVLLAGVIFRSAHTLANTQTGSFSRLPDLHRQLAFYCSPFPILQATSLANRSMCVCVLCSSHSAKAQPLQLVFLDWTCSWMSSGVGSAVLTDKPT